MVRSGFTFVELVLVVSLMAILLAASAPMAGQSIGRMNYQSTVDKVLAAVYKAQQYSMDGKAGQLWGVCVTGSIFRIFAGTCATPIQKEDFTIPDGVTITGLTDATFSKDRGEPTSSGTVTISSVQGYGTGSVVVGAAGLIMRN